MGSGGRIGGGSVWTWSNFPSMRRFLSLRGDSRRPTGAVIVGTVWHHSGGKAIFVTKCEPSPPDLLNVRYMSAFPCAGCNIAISNNVGGVKQFLSNTSVCTHRRAPFRSRRWFCAFPTWARFESFGSGTRSDPAISSITHCDQDSPIRTPLLAGSGMPNHYIGA